MPKIYPALVSDYDGTLAYAARPAPEVLDAITALRRAGVRVLLATGRILADLRRDFPDVDRWFDDLVLENGALLGDTPLAPRVPVELAEALRERGVHVDRGQVLLARHARHQASVRAEAERLGLEVALVLNRDALMVLPAGVSKVTGAAVALAAHGLTLEQAIGVGDSENDVELLRACGLGVAVENAVEWVRQAADRVLTRPGPAGIAEFLRQAALDASRRESL